MNHAEKAIEYHKKGFNCTQSVLAAFSDITGFSEQESFNIGAGFGNGAATGELCGAISGAIMLLGLMTPVDPEKPVPSKKKTYKLSREFQNRFTDIFGGLHCRELMKGKRACDERTPTARDMGLTRHCDIMVVTTVDILEAMLAEMDRGELL